MKVRVTGGDLVIKAHGPLDGSIASVKLNGQPYDKPYIDYADIVAGGVLEYTLERI